jgi:hypothetical protein
LLAKAKKLAKLSGGSEEAGGSKDSDAFFRASLEHEFDGLNRHCLDDE